jgi:RNase P protein component
VSSKVGNAVVRARLRRLMRELYRKRRARWPLGLDVVLVARTSAKDAGLPELARAFDQLERRIPKLPGMPRAAGSSNTRSSSQSSSSAPPPPSSPEDGTPR